MKLLDLILRTHVWIEILESIIVWWRIKAAVAILWLIGRRDIPSRCLSLELIWSVAK